MNTNDVATEIALKVIADAKFWTSIVGLIGLIIGALITIVGNLLLHWYQNHGAKRLDAARKPLLKIMLHDDRFANHWRRLDTLSRVIGADEETTKRLLIDIGARGSEKDDSLWGLIEYHPLDRIQD